ncbi:hypothetical protein WN944_023779 [Citrus x changshan-huyou]|uniref:Uncharacterized protein n=1 Tax=Citrus x changshan-huyou TaxID=2935761 RepID=A0AAP0LMH4_9ROSI
MGNNLVVAKVGESQRRTTNRAAVGTRLWLFDVFVVATVVDCRLGTCSGHGHLGLLLLHHYANELLLWVRVAVVTFCGWCHYVPVASRAALV